MSNIKELTGLYAIDKIIAIDPGSNGGLAIWSPNIDMKIIKMPSSIAAIGEILKKEALNSNTLVFIEEQHLRSDDLEDFKIFGIAKLVNHYKQIIGIMELLNIAYIELSPKKWQSYTRVNTSDVDYGERKKLFKEYAAKKFTNIRVTLWNADALCIMHYAKSQVTKNIAWLLKSMPAHSLKQLRVYKQKKDIQC